MTPATIDTAPVAPSAVESPPSPPDYAGMAEEICNNAVRLQLWDDHKLTTYEFRYDARRSDSKESLADKYRGEIKYYLPYFEKTHGPIRADDLSKLPRFIKECAACFSYLYALKRRNSKALCFDNDTDTLWAKRTELQQIEEHIRDLQDELYEAKEQRDELESQMDAAEKAEKQKGGA